MNVTILRTLTEKSILKFGKYHDYRVGDLIRLEKTVYLRWVYFNCDRITFIDDILDQIYLPEEYRITKPGKNPSRGEECNEFNFSKIGGFTKFKKGKHRKKVKRCKLISDTIHRAKRNSKGNLMRKNHGH